MTDAAAATVTESPWKNMDTAPRDRAVILFLPSASFDVDRDGRPSNVQHVRVVGHWDEKQEHWVAGSRPGRPAEKVYPSLWAVCPDEPVLGA